jgi:ribulose-phosphate 3-epimerase
LAADYARLGEALKLIKAAGASMVHLDVTDGHFVPGITAGQPVVKSLRKATGLVLDVHLLIEAPERFAGEFVAAGADRLAVHVEATQHLPSLVESIRARGAQAGVALNPATPVETVAEVFGEIDFLAILTSELQETAPRRNCVAHAVAKLRQAAQLREASGHNVLLQVEGCSVDLAHCEELVRAGADILVAGSDIFHGDAQQHLAEMIRVAASAHSVSRV